MGNVGDLGVPGWVSLGLCFVLFPLQLIPGIEAPEESASRFKISAFRLILKLWRECTSLQQIASLQMQSGNDRVIRPVVGNL